MGDAAANLPADVIAAVDKMAEFKFRNGDGFERMIREKHSQDPKFSFLFDTSSPAHAYYQRKLASLYSTKPIMPLMAAAPSAPAPRSLHPPPAGAPPPPPPMQLFQPHLVHQQVRLACGGPDLIACTLPCAAADRRTRNHLRGGFHGHYDPNTLSVILPKCPARPQDVNPPLDPLLLLVSLS